MFDAVATLDPRMALGLHTLAAIGTVVAVLAVAALLRDKGGAGGTGDPFGIYESGAPAARVAVAPVPAAYFQIAAFFVIFDFEAAVLFTWAVSAPAAGVAGLASAAVFITVLLVALFYLWADGALDVGANSRGGAADAGARAPGRLP